MQMRAGSGRERARVGRRALFVGRGACLFLILTAMAAVDGLSTMTTTTTEPIGMWRQLT